MSERGRDETKPDDAAVERLRAAVRAEDPGEHEGAPVDADLVWRAVSGELPAEERRAVVERVAADPAWAAAWRLAVELSRAASEAAPPMARRADIPRARRGDGDVRQQRRFRFAWSQPLWGVAATAALALIVVGVVMREEQEIPEPPRVRGGDTAAVVSRVPEAVPLKRADCVLRWSGGPEGTRWSVRLSTEDLGWVHRVDSLETPEYRVPAQTLSPLKPGTKLLWQVEARLPDGQVLRSATFVHLLE
ncbi:hypothetical protein [Corallococcus macrosporus]|uniref:Uncharacterized protein n=1 Tax=Corallococcus macrosporus DSM 14697 TaxID=1189310 RepID=A0A250JRS7_9BACT|nr:hypothetical protein [Corallococcus macrosporus]ATB46579.1 hypothetical protein MYMAC_002184 [Corallococcus macrosporus DSM 14697]